MAIRRPSVYREREFIFQDFLYLQEDDSQLRYILVKWDGAPYDSVSQTFDYPTPEFKGGDVVARLEYMVSGKLVIIEDWWINFRDEWPLRLAIQFLANCLYSPGQGFSIQVRREAYPFWVSENFFPLTNDPEDFLIGK